MTDREPIDDERREAGRYWLERCRDALAGTTRPGDRPGDVPTVRTPNELDFPPPSVPAGLDATPEATP